MSITDEDSPVSEATGASAQSPNERTCRERAAPVPAEGRTELLRFANPAWVARVANGVDWMLWGGAGMFVFAVLGHLPSFQRVIPALSFIGQLAECYGLWLCTTPEPNHSRIGSIVRRFSRGSAAAGLVLYILHWLLAEGALGEFLGGFCSWTAGSAASLAVLVVLARLAARLPSALLTERIVSFAWVYAIGTAVATAILLAQWACYLLDIQLLSASGLEKDASTFAIMLGPVLFIARLLVLFTVSKALESPKATGSTVAMTAAPNFDAALLDATGAVAFNTPCRECGYNLRGLRPDGRCPECSAPLLESLRSNLLHFTNLRWRARIVTAIDWMLWAGAGALLANLLTFVSVYVPAVFGPTRPLTVIMQIAGYYGVWLCAAPEPGSFERGASIRKCARVAAVAWLVLRVLGWLLEANPFGAFVGRFSSACVGSAADVAVLVLLARLSARIPNARLARRIVQFTWFYAIGIAIVLAMGLVGWLCGLLGANSVAAQRFLRIIPSILVVPMLILLGGRLVVLFIVSRALSPAAR